MHRTGEAQATDDRARLVPMTLESENTSSLWQRRGITLLTVDPYMTQEPDPPSSNTPAPPPRWRTKEFWLYFLVLFTIGPYMVYVPIRLSYPETNANYGTYQHHLVPGWIQGRLRDDSDYQYRLFRENMAVIVALIAAFTLVSWAVRWLGRTWSLRLRRPFLTLASIACICALHGTNAIKLVGLALGNYALVRAGTRYASPTATTAAVWVYNCAALYLVFYLKGIPYGLLSDRLAWLDAYTGMLSRWYISYNFSMLRLVSYALDYQWAAHATPAPAADGAPGVPDAKARVRQSRPLAEYDLPTYLLYLFYPPLFIAGPILTFNDFACQLRRPLPIPWRRVGFYALRCGLLIVAMEFLMHYLYVNAIKNAHAWAGNTPMELSMIGFWNLMFVWLKLLIPWRLFRLWALLDGMDTPENMIRAMFNNYSVMGFWRSWHRSYNLWVVRYIYIPVGGARRMLPATLLVFTFVALWHDLSFRLLAWAWLVTLFIAPEALATYLLPAKRYENRAWYRHACALGGALNVLMMITANLVGFVMGLDGVQYLWAQLTDTWTGGVFMVQAVAALFVGVQLMFEYRAEERRRHLDRKC